MRALRRVTIAVLVLALLVWIAWRSGERDPIDEVALAQAATGVPLESFLVRTGDVELHVVAAGPAGGPPVVLLHGFPEFWYSWHQQLAILAKAGFRAMAPDLRGYNRSDKPHGASHYASQVFAADVLALLDKLGYEDAFVAGHDVGGGVAWRLVLEHPERVRKAVIFNAGHPFVWTRTRPQDDAETISWFRTFFRLPWLPELAARSGGWWLLSRNLRETSRPGTFDDDALAVYQAAWSRDNAISTMIDVYRADHREIPEEPGDTGVPVRVVWGRNDAFFPPGAAALTEEIVGPDAFLEVPDATHWILLEEPELTGLEMVRFFGS